MDEEIETATAQDDCQKQKAKKNVEINRERQKLHDKKMKAEAFFDLVMSRFVCSPRRHKIQMPCIHSSNIGGHRC